MNSLTELQNRLFRVAKKLSRKTSLREVHWTFHPSTGYSYQVGEGVVRLRAISPSSGPDLIDLRLLVNGKTVTEIIVSDGDYIYTELKGIYEIVNAHGSGAITALEAIEEILDSNSVDPDDVHPGDVQF